MSTVNNAAMNTEVHVSFQIRIFSRYMPRSGTARSYGNLQEHILRVEKEMATHSSVLAWRTPWTEEPGGLQSMGSQESDTT